MSEYTYPFECKTYGGQTAVILGENPTAGGWFVGYIKHNMGSFAWRKSDWGSNYPYHKYNLIKPIELKEGKKYVTCSGVPVFICFKKPDGKFIGLFKNSKHSHYWDKNGKQDIEGLDIKEEIT